MWCLLRSAITMVQWSFSSSRTSYDMVVGFSFGATVRGFADAAGAFTTFNGAFFLAAWRRRGFFALEYG
jgi:hypothetical protein